MNYYKFVNFHIHSPSEHTFNGENYDLELHLVHEMIDPDPSKNQFAVVAVFFDTKLNNGRNHPFFEALNVKAIHNQNPYIVDEMPLM